MMIKMRTAVIGLCVVAVVAIGANALAAGGSSKSMTRNAPAQGKPPAPPTKAQMEKMRKEMDAQRDAHDKALADKLGISVETLQAAEKAVKKDELDKAVADGKLTSAQEDAILACDDDPANCDPSKLPHGGPGGPHGGPGGPGGGPGFHMEFRGGPPPAAPNGSQPTR